MSERHFINGKEVDRREWNEYSKSERAREDLRKSEKQYERPIEIRGGKK